MGGISEPVGEPVILVQATYANRFIWRATDPRDGTSYTLRLIGDGFTYDASGLPTYGQVARVEIRTQDLSGGDSWAMYHMGGVTPASLGSLIDPFTWVDTQSPVRPVIALPAGVPVTYINHPHYPSDGAYTNGTALSDVIGPLRGLAMRVTAGSGDDTVAGSAQADTLHGEGGSDLILAGGGHDSLTGGAGFDTLRGGLGDDRLEGGLDGDDLFGAAGNDTLFGEQGNDHLFGGDGNDAADGGYGDDRISMGAGDDTAIDLGFSSDTLIGGSGADWLEGGQGNDLLLGGTENDSLNGGADYDSLNGGAGDDYLISGADVDLLRGGEGADVFVFSLAQAQDGMGPSETTIADFTSGQDRLMIATGTIANMADAFALFLAVAQDVPGGVLWTDDSGATVFLRGVSLAGLSVGDVVFDVDPLFYYLP